MNFAPPILESDLAHNGRPLVPIDVQEQLVTHVADQNRNRNLCPPTDIHTPNHSESQLSPLGVASRPNMLLPGDPAS